MSVIGLNLPSTTISTWEGIVNFLNDHSLFSNIELGRTREVFQPSGQAQHKKMFSLQGNKQSWLNICLGYCV